MKSVFFCFNEILCHRPIIVKNPHIQRHKITLYNITDELRYFLHFFFSPQKKHNYNFLQNISKLLENKILVLYKTINLNY